MAENKTKPSELSVQAYIDGLDNDARQEDSTILLKLFQRITGMEPRMWGASLIGYGHYHYKYESGRQGDFF